MFYICFGEDIFVAKKTATRAKLVFGGHLALRKVHKSLPKNPKKVPEVLGNWYINCHLRNTKR